MNMYELMNAHSVMINGGSGVLAAALSNDYSYILTARHVLGKRENIEITDSYGNPIEALEIIEHPNPAVDCAIIKVAFVSGICLTRYVGDSPPHQAHVMLVGYPATRRGKTAVREKIKQQDGKFTTSVNGEFVFNAEGVPGKDLIKGMSGGGVYYLIDNDAYLLGVECEMDGTVEAEQFGRVKCYDLSHFDQIISAANLSPIVPSYLECFSKLKQHAFRYKMIDENNIFRLKNELNDLVDYLINNGFPTPYQILLKYGDSLLFSCTEDTALHDSKLWISYLEYAVIGALIDQAERPDTHYFEGLERRRRLIYSRSGENWLIYLSEIYLLAKTLLDRNGSLLISSCQDTPLPQPPDWHSEKIIGNIAMPLPVGGGFRIDKGDDNICQTFKIAHIGGMHHECIERKESLFATNNPNEHLKILRDSYNEYVK